MHDYDQYVNCFHADKEKMTFLLTSDFEKCQQEHEDLKNKIESMKEIAKKQIEEMMEFTKSELGGLQDMPPDPTGSILNQPVAIDLGARNSEAFSSRFNLLDSGRSGGFQSHSTLAIGRMSPMMRGGGPFRKTKLFG